MHGLKNVGGGEHSISYLISGLNKNTFSPVVIYSFKNKIIEKLIKKNIPTIKVNIDYKIASIYRDELSFNPIKIIKYFFHIIKASIEVKKIIINNKIALIHPHDNLSKIIGFLASKGAGVKSVAHCRDLLKTNFIEKLLLYFQFFTYDRIITVSEANRNLFKFFNKVPSKVKKVYNGIDLDEFNKNKIEASKNFIDIKKFNLVVGIVGVFDELKGHIYLFNAIKKMTKNKIACLVVGDGREKKKLLDYVNKNNLNEFIFFTGYVENVQKYLKLMDVLALPSTQESFPRVMIEAMAMGVPVIGSNVGGIPEAVINDKTGIIIPPRNSIAIIEAIMRFISEPGLAEKMGVYCEKYCEKNFDIKYNIEKTEKIYKSLISE